MASDEKKTSIKTKAWQVKTKAGPLELVEIELPPLSDEEVEVKLVASGICASDIDAISGNYPPALYPFPITPGHEGVGHVVAVGKLVTTLKIGSRVGLGVYRSCCNSCGNCCNGSTNLCPSKKMMFALQEKGTFSEIIRIKAQFAFQIPDGFEDLEVVGPLMCAGTTVFSPFKVHNIRPGHKVAVAGIGGLGHLALQFARAWGCEVYALSGSANKAESIKKMGAHHFVDTKKDPNLTSVVGTFDFIIATNSGPDVNIPALMGSLTAGGKLILIGFPGFQDIPVSPVQLIMMQKTICGSAAGSTGVTSDMLKFAALHNIRPIVEKFPFSHVNAAIARVKDNNVRFRAVLCHSLDPKK